MKNKRQINGRRFVFALAAAELELRKQEGWQHCATAGCLEKLVNIGYGLQEENTQMWQHRKVGNLTRRWESFKLAEAWNVAQAIKTYDQALDWAMCFVMRYPGQLEFVAQSATNDNLGSKFRLAQYRKTQEYKRWKQEREEDAADDGEQEIYPGVHVPLTSFNRLKSDLEKRLPALMTEFKAAVESLGLVY